jgi:hypothetical protein
LPVTTTPCAVAARSSIRLRAIAEGKPLQDLELGCFSSR